MSEPVFIVGDSLEAGHPGLEVTQADQEDQDLDPEVEAKLAELQAEAREKEAAADEPTTENEDGVEVNEQDAHRDEAADDQPPAGGFSLVFGDTATDQGDVVSADNEQATVDAAAAEAAGADVTHNEARRQGDLENVPSDVDDADEDPDGDGPKLNAPETIAKIEASSSVEEVDELSKGDDRVTVQRAADKRKEELADES